MIGLSPDNHEDYDIKCTLSQNSGGGEKILWQFFFPEILVSLDCFFLTCEIFHSIQNPKIA